MSHIFSQGDLSKKSVSKKEFVSKRNLTKNFFAELSFLEGWGDTIPCILLLSLYGRHAGGSLQYPAVT
jgi:hypothetical protein